MDFEFEKIMAKISGANTELFAENVISIQDKNQINFALNQMFTGLSTLEWLSGGKLADAWNVALDKMRDFVFSIPDKNYVTDYLQIAVFEHRKITRRIIQDSVHAQEFLNCDETKRNELTTMAKQKIDEAIQIIKDILAKPNFVKTVTVRENNKMKIKQKEREHEYERERTK